MRKIALVGGRGVFRDFLKSCGADFDITTVDKAITDISYDGMILLPDYDNGEETVEALDLDLLEILAERKTKGFRMYSENYLSNNSYNDSIFGYEVLGSVCHTNSQTLCAVNGLQYILGSGRIIQAAERAYLPCRPSLGDMDFLVKKVLLFLGDYVGTSQVTTLNVENSYPALIRTADFITSSVALTDYDTVNMRPNCRFKKLFGYVFSFVTGVDEKNVEAAFEKCYPPLQTRFDVNESLKGVPMKEHYEKALRDAVKWHFDSGMILGDHGEEGSIEMIMSNNKQKPYTNRRVDAGMYTGWLLYAAGNYFGNEEWKLTGSNVFGYYMEHAQLQGGIVDGMFDWYYNKHAAPRQVYSIDVGRDGIALCNMYRLTKNEKYLSDIKRLAESLCGWINDDRLYCSHIRYGERGTEKHTVGTGTCTPAIYGEISSFMAMASKITGDRKYVQKMAKITDMLRKIYPEYDYYGHTTSSRMARLLMTMLPVHLSGERDYTDIINEAIDYLSSISMPCGGIYSEDNISFERSKEKNRECGVTTTWDNDRISDQLYCVNNAIAALSLLKELPDDSGINKKKGLELFYGLLEYIVKIQIVSDDKRFNGGWMRAYSMTHGEYYGLDADVLWSCYCIMAGWTMGILPLALLSELEGKCSYYISR